MTRRIIEVATGRLEVVTVSDDPKRPGMLIGRYQGNIPRVLYGRKWQKALRGE